MKQQTRLYQRAINSYLKCIYDNLDLRIALADHLLKKKKYKNSNKQDNHDLFITTKQIMLDFNIKQLTESLKICLVEQLLIRYYVTNHLTLLKIQYMMDSKRSCFSGLQIVLIKIPICLHGQRSYLRQLDKMNLLHVVVLKIKVCQTKNELNNYTNQLSENLNNEKYPYLLCLIHNVQGTDLADVQISK